MAAVAVLTTARRQPCARNCARTSDSMRLPIPWACCDGSTATALSSMTSTCIQIAAVHVIADLLLRVIRKQQQRQEALARSTRGNAYEDVLHKCNRQAKGYTIDRLEL